MKSVLTIELSNEKCVDIGAKWRWYHIGDVNGVDIIFISIFMQRMVNDALQCGKWRWCHAKDGKWR